MPQRDPVLEEIHAIRDGIAKASDGDLKKIAEAARIRQREAGRAAVRLPPKPVHSAKKAS
jgi:hypothetical protein